MLKTESINLIYLISIIVFVFLFLKYSNNIPIKVTEYLSNYYNQLFVLIVIFLFCIYIDKFIGGLMFILFFIQFRSSIKNY